MKSYNIDRCNKQAPNLRTAYYNDFKHASTRAEVEEMRAVYEDETGRIWSQSMTCGTCVLKLYKAVGELYFKAVERIEKEPEPDENKAAEAVVKPKRAAIKNSKDNGKDKKKGRKAKGVKADDR